MILCVCLSPALDLTYRTGAFALGATNRVSEVLERAGGKAVNVARILHALGEPVELLVPLGGPDGEGMARDLAGSGIVTHVVQSGAPTRRTVTVVDDSGATILVEPAAIDCWPEVLGAFRALLQSADVIVISGVVPAGVPLDAMSTLVGLARAADLPVIVDTSGEALADALSAGPTVVKPNADELGFVAQAGRPGGGGPRAGCHVRDDGCRLARRRRSRGGICRPGLESDACRCAGRQSDGGRGRRGRWLGPGPAG